MAESSVTTSNPTKGMQKFLGIGVFGGLEKRIGNNEKKITKITSILKLRKENVGKNLKGEDINSENLAERLNNIAQTLAVLTRALKQQLITQKRSADVNKQNINEQKKKNREKDLEKQKEKQSGGGGAGRVVNAIKAPFTGIFDAAKKFFGSIVAGSSVLGLMKWLKEMDASQWEGMIKTLQDNAGLVLAGILAIAAIPVLGTVATFVLALVGAVTIFGPMIAVIGQALAWITAAVAAIAALWGATKLAQQAYGGVRNMVTGGEEFSQIHDELDQRLIDAGMSKTGMVNKSKGSRYVGGSAEKYGTEEQKRIWEEVKAERERLWALKKERDEAIKQVVIDTPKSGSKRENVRGGGSKIKRWHTEEDLEIIKKKQNEIRIKYAKLVESKGTQISIPSPFPSPANIGDTNVTPPKIDQPLGGEGSVNFLPLPNTSSEGGASSSVEGGNNAPSFSSSSGKVGNQFVLGAWNA